MDSQLTTVEIIEAILFWKGEPLSKKDLARLVKISLEDLDPLLHTLHQNLLHRGIVLVSNGDEVMLGTHKDASKIIEDMRKEELSKELSKATLETLAIVIYMHPVRRSAIDYIRGVNSQFSLRHLEMRGLIQKYADTTDSRVYLYRPTLEALAFLGVSRVEDIPSFAIVKEKISAFEAKKEEEDMSTKVEDETHHVAQED